MKIVTALFLFLESTAASAEWWREDIERGSDAAGLVVAVCAGIGYFYVRDEWRRSPEKGLFALAVCVALAVGGYYSIWVRALLGALTVWFLVWGLINRP